MHDFLLPDMSCGHCVAAITEAARQLDPQARLSVDLPAHRVAVDSSLPREVWTKALIEAGYAPAA